MELNTTLKKAIIRREIKKRGRRLGKLAKEECFQSNFAFVIQPLAKSDVQLSHAERAGLKKPGGNIQAILNQLVDVHNEYLAGEVFYEAIVDALHIQEIAEFKKTSYKEAMRAAKWYVDRQRNNKLSPAQEISFFFNAVATPLLKYSAGQKTAINILFNPFLTCLVREYFFQFTLKYTDWYRTGRFQPDYTNEIASVRTFMEHIDEVFALNDYVDNYFQSEIIVDELDVIPMIDSEERSDMLYDIGEMIPILMRNWDPLKHPVEFAFSDKFIAYFDISKSYPEVIFAVSGDSPDQIKNSSYTIAWDFCTYDVFWMLDQWNVHEGINLLESHFLPRFHEYLLGIYSKVVVRGGEHTPASKAALEIPFEEALHVHLNTSPDEPETDSTAGKVSEPTPLAVSQLRWNRFEKHMEQCFDCSFASGKGSEIKVQRPGSRIYTVGHHTKNPLISSWMIKKILKRLDISITDWSASLQYL